MAEPRRVLLIDDDHDLAAMVRAVLTDEGYHVSVLADVNAAAVRAAVGAQEPDCVLLDGEGAIGYGVSWSAASWMRERERPIPTVMFTVDAVAVHEARARQTARSQAAGFSSVLPKPFDLDDLLDAVARAVGQAAPVDRSAAGDDARTAALAERLRAAGATDVRTSRRQEWAAFRTPTGVDAQLYWSPGEGVYHLTWTDPTGRRLRPIGQFHDLAAALAVAAAG